MVSCEEISTAHETNKNYSLWAAVVKYTQPCPLDGSASYGQPVGSGLNTNHRRYMQKLLYGDNATGPTRHVGLGSSGGHDDFPRLDLIAV